MLLWPATGAAKTYSLPAADIAVRIQADGSLLVRERISFDFSGPFSGAYRDIPLRKGESIDHVIVSEGNTRYRPGANTELGGFGLPDTFGVTRIDNGVRIVWHYTANSERRTFDVSYRFRGLAVAYNDVIDVNLRVWGNHWPVGVGRLTASMQLPRPIALSPSYRVWGSPVWVHGTVTRLPPRSLLEAAQVPAHQFVELRMVLPRRLLTSTAGAQARHGSGLKKIVAEEAGSQRAYEHDRERIDDAKRHLGRTALYLLLLGQGPALALMLLVWLVYGRERKTGYDREYEQGPPTETEPSLVPPLLRQEKAPGSNEFTATLFDLIRRGRYKATPVTTERKIWGGMRRQDVADLQLTLGDKGVALTDFEEPVTEVVDSVVGAEGERLTEFREQIESNRATNSRRFTKFKENVTSAVDTRDWYLNDGVRLLGLGILVFGVAAVVLLWLAIHGFRSAAPRWSDVVMIALGVCAATNAVALIAAGTSTRL